MSISTSNVVIETIKRAEDGRGLIVRLFENQRNRGKFTLRTGFTLSEAYHSNLLEEDGQAVSVQGNAIQLDITPYQILNLRLIPARR